MCYFTTIQFWIYPERTRLHPDYFQEGESEEEHYTRTLAERRAQNAINRELNKIGKVASFAEIIEACRMHEKEMQEKSDRKRFKKKRKSRKEEERSERKVAEKAAEEEQQENEQKAA